MTEKSDSGVRQTWQETILSALGESTPLQWCFHTGKIKQQQQVFLKVVKILEDRIHSIRELCKSTKDL